MCVDTPIFPLRAILDLLSSVKEMSRKMSAKNLCESEPNMDDFSPPIRSVATKLDIWLLWEGLTERMGQNIATS